MSRLGPLLPTVLATLLPLSPGCGSGPLAPVAAVVVPLGTRPDADAPEPTPSDPVTATMTVRAGDPGPPELRVSVRIARAHYLHADAGDGGKFAPLAIEAELPAGVSAVGDWSFPPPEDAGGGKPVYREAVLLRLPLAVAPDASPGTRTVVATLRCQACNEELCWPPSKIPLSAPLVIGLATPHDPPPTPR